MKKSLLTIDWDYFMPYINQFNVSCLENRRNIDKHWYKIYLQNKERGIDITREMRVGHIVNNFWQKINDKFIIPKDIKVVISDSHKYAYDIAKREKCTRVFNFDAHTDLGYGGLESLQFEVNCANWLGRLLKDNIIDEADIVLSPYSAENSEEFSEINDKYNVKYPIVREMNEEVTIDAIHVCRSGAWTAPWLDDEFFKFVNEISNNIEYMEFEKRVWNVENISLADRIEYMLFN